MFILIIYSTDRMFRWHKYLKSNVPSLLSALPHPLEVEMALCTGMLIPGINSVSQPPTQQILPESCLTANVVTVLHKNQLVFFMNLYFLPTHKKCFCSSVKTLEICVAFVGSVL